MSRTRESLPQRIAGRLITGADCVAITGSKRVEVRGLNLSGGQYLRLSVGHSPHYYVTAELIPDARPIERVPLSRSKVSDG